VFIFSEGQKKLSEAELERLVEVDMSEWMRIKSSKKIDDWVNYLRTFPNGRFAEIAQMRLARLLTAAEAQNPALAPVQPSPQPHSSAEQQRLENEHKEAAKAEEFAAEKRLQEKLERLKEQERLAQEERERKEKNLLDAEHLAADENKRREQEMAALAAKPTPASISEPTVAAVPGTLMINIGADLPIPELMTPSNNPFSAGRYPLARKYTVGDYFEVRTYDIISRAGPVVGLTVTSVDDDADRVEINGGGSIWDTMGNIIKAPSYGPSDVPRQFHPAELQVGKRAIVKSGVWRVLMA
jgi:hypothetical protein